jgi:quercetin dioxygenase-like cupin family protein
MTIRVFHVDRPSHLLPLISSDARLVVWPGTGAELANLNYVVMEPGEANTPHAHQTSEDTIYILRGRGTIDDLTNGTQLPFEAGDVLHVPPGVRHAVRADRGERIVSFGGPCPPDRALFGHAVAAPNALPVDDPVDTAPA